MADTFRTVWGQTLLRAPVAGPILAQNWVQNSFRRIAEKRLWSWLTLYGQFLFPNELTAGKVSVTFNSNQVVGDATAAAAWLASPASVVGQQFRIGVLSPIYDVIAFDGVSTLTLGAVWGGSTNASIGYEIYQAYVTVPTGFFSFQTVIDPQRNWQLWANRWTQSDLNTWDSQRASQGNPYAVVFRDYDPTGITNPPLPRYELWPHQKSQYVIPYLCVKRATDISAAGATIPPFIRGDVILEGALADAARWPGPSMDVKNPYFNPSLARDHESRFLYMVGELERQDDEVFEQDISYQMFTAGLPWAPFPGDARFWQSHLLPAMGGVNA